MASYFGIEDARDCLEDFRRKHDEFVRDNLNIDKATQCAEACWSVAEWIAYDIYRTPKDKEIERLKAEFLEECLSLRYVQALTTLRKHREQRKPSIRLARRHDGDYSSDYSKYYDISRLVIVDLSDEHIPVEDVFSECLKFWDTKFQKLGI